MHRALLTSSLVLLSCSAQREAPAHPTPTPTNATTAADAPIASSAPSSTPTSTSGADPCAECKAGVPPVKPDTLCCTIVGNGWVATSCQTKAVCDGANAKAAADTEKARCKSPGECPAQKACVVGSLGGAMGCTGESCCGAAECTNGCRDDADCPSCRPKCKMGAGATTGTCGNGASP